MKRWTRLILEDETITAIMRIEGHRTKNVARVVSLFQEENVQRWILTHVLRAELRFSIGHPIRMVLNS